MKMMAQVIKLYIEEIDKLMKERLLRRASFISNDFFHKNWPLVEILDSIY